MQITLTAPFDFTDPNAVRQSFMDINQKVAESIKDTITIELERSVELASFVGNAPDPEIVRNIIQNIKIDAIPTWPPGITIEYQDAMGRWWGQEPPEELIEMVRNIIDQAIEKWTRTLDQNQIFTGMFK